MSSHLWTFDPPFPEEYRVAPRRGILLGAEPNGEADRPGARDMGAWCRSPPKSGTRFARAIMTYAAGLDGLAVDPRSVRPEEVFRNWRIADICPEEAGPEVVGDFPARVRRNLDGILRTIVDDDPWIIVPMGTHAQDAFQEILAPRLLEKGCTARCIGLPHPSVRTAGYVPSDVLFEAARRAAPLGQPMPVYRSRGGWR